MSTYLTTERLGNRQFEKRHRSGVTLMEIIISIGIILTGLLGLSALLPIAAKNAEKTIQLDRSVSESASARAIGKASLATDLSRLVVLDKATAGSPAVASGYMPSNSLQTIEAKIASLGALVSPGALNPGGDMEGLAAGICIDPLGVPELNLLTTANMFAGTGFVGTPNGTSPFLAPTSSDSAYDYSRFPYFGERYSILGPPNGAIGTPATAPAWPLSPRMYRVTLVNDDYPLYPGTSTSVFRYQLINRSFANRLFRGSDSSFINGTGDQKKLTSLSTSTFIDDATGFVVDGGTTSESRYTWFATIAPPSVTSSVYRQSIVVVRDRAFETPQRPKDILALQRSSYTVDDADDNPVSERLAWAHPKFSTGFRGGGSVVSC